MITPDRMKAYLDDLALLSVKHGIGVVPSHSRGFVAIELSGEPTFHGYFGDQIKGSWLIEMKHRLTWKQSHSAEAISENPAEATAHQRIALAKSLASARASLPTGPDLPTDGQEAAQ